ncbi:hypothetical protein ERJ75_001285200 [Trypanosoma vivax]|nr:hypothetical protein ERJ75_001285200 [Trypanosoma vivax]
MVREGSARGRTGPAAPKHGPQNGVRADARWHGALGVPGRMVDGSVIAEIVEAATRAVMQRMFDGAGQQVCGDGRRNYVSPQKASTPSFVRPMPGAFSGPANAQGQSGNTQGRDNRPLSGTKVKWTSNNQQKHVQQHVQHSSNSSSIRSHGQLWWHKRRHRNRDIGPCRGHRSVLQGGRADTATRADPQVRVSEAMVRKRREQGPRTPAAQQGKGHRGTKAERGTKGHAATAASVAHAQKTPPPFAEDEVDLGVVPQHRAASLSSGMRKDRVAPARHQREDAVVEHDGARGVTCTTAPLRVRAQARGRRPPTLSRTARGGGQAVPVHAGVRARGAAVWAVVCARVGPRRRLALPRRGNLLAGTARHLRRTIKSRNGTHRGSMRPAAASGAGDCAGGGGRQRACAPGALSGQARGDPEVRRVWSGRGAARRGRQLPDSVRRHGGAAAATARASPPGR